MMADSLAVALLSGAVLFTFGMYAVFRTWF